MIGELTLNNTHDPLAEYILIRYENLPLMFMFGSNKCFAILREWLTVAALLILYSLGDVMFTNA